MVDSTKRQIQILEAAAAIRAQPYAHFSKPKMVVGNPYLVTLETDEERATIKAVIMD